jgi:peptidoglycan-associated lipoprotein
MLFGADTGFGPVVGNSIGTLYAGARLVYEISSMGTTGLPLRFLAQGLTDLNVSGRQVSLITAGVQIGIPIRASRSADVQARSTGTDVLSVSHSAPIRLVLDPQVVFFGTNSSKLREPILESLGQIGDYLSSNPGQWGRVEVTGHADRRGSYQYNLKLSKKRAESVKTALVSGDSLGERVRVEGYSYSKPEDPGNNPAAWAKNRRVEVVFYDVRDPEPLLKLIRELPLEKTAQGELK